jgi:hypothetical protein
MSLAKYNGVVQDAEGNGVAGAHIEVRREVPGQPLAALKSVRAGTTGQDNPFDADAYGRFSFFAIGGAYQIRAYTGPSGAPTFEVFLNYVAVGLAQETDATAEGLVEREVTAAGTVTVTNDDADVILINKTSGAPTAVNLPDPSTTTKKVRIVDRKYDAATNNITITSLGTSKLIMGAASYIIDSNGGSIELKPLDDGTGWV